MNRYEAVIVQRVKFDAEDDETAARIASRYAARMFVSRARHLEVSPAGTCVTEIGPAKGWAETVSDVDLSNVPPAHVSFTLAPPSGRPANEAYRPTDDEVLTRCGARVDLSDYGRY